MLTAARFALCWCYREGARSVRRTLSSYNAEPCIEAARLLAGNPYAFDIEVRQINTGQPIAWEAPGTGLVLCPPTPEG